MPPLAVPVVVLRRILGNLLVNAAQAQPTGGAVVCEARVAAGLAQVTVRDEGQGVPPSLRAALFQPGVTSNEGPGRGLGLAGARALARRWGGDLIHQESSGGACFQLSLPLAAHPAAAPADGSPCVKSPAGLRILVVDDELPVQEMLLELLAVEGHRPTVAADHDSALASFVADHYDAALIDLGLPGRPGDALAAALRQLDPALAVILVTGWGREQELATQPSGSVDLTAVKPLDLPQLRHLLARAADLTATRRRGRSEDGKED